MSGKGFEAPQLCDECGKIRWLRPYGPGGRCVCYPCFVDHPEWGPERAARRANHLLGQPIPDEYLTEVEREARTGGG